MTKKIILALAHSPYIGGAELALASLIDSTRDKYEWRIVFAGPEKPDPGLTKNLQRFISLDLPWWCYEANDEQKKLNKQRLMNALATLKDEALQADILLTNSITIPWLGFIAHEVNKPHIWYVHEFGDADHDLQFISGYSETLATISICSSRILTISEAVKKHLVQIIPEEKIDLIHQAINLDQLLDLPLANNRAPKNLLSLGALKPSKGQYIAAEAVNALRDSSDMTLDIFGPVANRNYLELLKKLHSRRVSVHPGRYVPADELSSHDTLLVTSENEALGRVTLEGLAAGRLVIGFACPSTRELLANGRGILYTPNTSDALCAAIKVAKEFRFDPQENRRFVAETYNPKRQSSDFSACVIKASYTAVPHSTSQEEYLDILMKKNLFMSNSRRIRSRIRRLAGNISRKIILGRR